MTVKHGNGVVEFKLLLLEYLKVVEGYRTTVYKDHKGNPTVGIGHLLPSGSRLKVGDKISDADVAAFFQQDYDRLNISAYVDEVQTWNGNQRLAIASFIWSHGDAGYKSSQLRAMLIAGDYTRTQVLDYLKKNWDKKSPKNQARNAKDLSLFFSSTPFNPSGGFFQLDQQLARVGWSVAGLLFGH